MKQVTPDEMQVITNIQGMRAMMNPDYYDPIKDFQSLSLYGLEVLREIQNKLIPNYNKSRK
jgi:hypothetical protein